MKITKFLPTMNCLRNKIMIISSLAIFSQPTGLCNSGMRKSTYLLLAIEFYKNKMIAEKKCNIDADEVKGAH